MRRQQRFTLYLLSAVLALVLLSGCGAGSAAPTAEVATTVREATHTATRPAVPSPTASHTAAPSTSTATLNPTATATPSATPTPVRPTPTLSPELLSLRVVFVRDEQLWLWQGGTAVPLTTAEEDTKTSISDDGELIVFSRERGLWAIRADGTNERSLIGADEFDTLEPGLSPDEMAWIRGSHTLLFNTARDSEEGYHPRYDLHRIEVETGRWQPLLSRGEGGRFKISPDGQRVSLVTPEVISVAAIDGTGRQTLLTYDLLYTYSGGTTTANPIWTPNSDALVVAIRPQDPLGDDADEPVKIWRLPVDGREPILVNELLVPSFFHAVHVSPDGSRIAFATARTIVGGRPEEVALHTSNLDGTDDVVFFEGTGGFERWNPDSNRYVFWQGEERDFYLGWVDRPDTLFLTPLNIISLAWIASDHALYRTGENRDFSLHLGFITESDATILVAEGVSNRWFDFSR